MMPMRVCFYIIRDFQCSRADNKVGAVMHWCMLYCFWDEEQINQTNKYLVAKNQTLSPRSQRVAFRFFFPLGRHLIFKAAAALNYITSRRVTRDRKEPKLHLSQVITLKCDQAVELWDVSLRHPSPPAGIYISTLRLTPSNYPSLSPPPVCPHTHTHWS